MIQNQTSPDFRFPEIGISQTVTVTTAVAVSCRVIVIVTIAVAVMAAVKQLL